MSSESKVQRLTTTSKDISGFMEDRTRQEIDDYCEKVLNLHLSSRPEGKLLFEGVQIIRQLQNQSRGVRVLNPVEFEVF